MNGFGSLLLAFCCNFKGLVFHLLNIKSLSCFHCILLVVNSKFEMIALMACSENT